MEVAKYALSSSIGSNEMKNSPAYSRILQKWSYIEENHPLIIFNVEKQLNEIDFEETNWIELGKMFYKLMAMTRLDIVMNASYTYMKTNFASTHEFTKLIASHVVETFEQKSWSIFTEEDQTHYEMADHETDQTYREDLAVVIRVIRKKYREAEHLQLMDELKKWKPSRK